MLETIAIEVVDAATTKEVLHDTQLRALAEFDTMLVVYGRLDVCEYKVDVAKVLGAAD